MKDVIESQKRKLQTIIDGIPDGMIMFDSNDGSILTNPVADEIVRTYSGRDVTLKSIEKTFKISFMDLLNELKENNKTLRKEIILGENENKRIYDANVANLENPDGLIQGLVMVLRDVTKERELERMKREFISNVSHELRTPAAIVKEFISILSDGVAGNINKEQKEYLSIMLNNVERLLRLIENLLNMSRIESGRFKINRKDVDLNKLLIKIKESLEVRLLKNGQKLKLNIPRKLPVIKADPDALMQIITNFVDNARKFSSSDSIITIEAYEKDNKIVTCIKDRGRGISPEHLDRIFERFYRIEMPEDEKKEGVGLGLPIVKELVTLHGGDVWVESEVNKGSCFYFSLPVN